MWTYLKEPNKFTNKIKSESHMPSGHSLILFRFNSITLIITLVNAFS